MPRFQARRIPDFSQKLVIRTSMTKYIKPTLVKYTIPSYRGATLQDLYETILQYVPKRLNRVTIFAGFIDNKLLLQEVELKWKNLINLITNKFQRKSLIVPKTFQSLNNNDVNGKRYIHNHMLFNLKNSFFNETKALQMRLVKSKKKRVGPEARKFHKSKSTGKKSSAIAKLIDTSKGFLSL